jgi:hypothetical protein
MAKNLNNDAVGDLKMFPLQPSEVGLSIGWDQVQKLQAERSEPAFKPSVFGSFAAAGRHIKSEAWPVLTCKQTLWFSFFFDGTGNNRYADEGMRKHSNVAKLFLVHKPNDKVNGRYGFYFQGVGTYFPEVGDDGGDITGLSFGRLGTERLEYALKKFDEEIRHHLALARSPSNPISEINISVFGFSRGAALARAFVNLLLEERCVHREGKWLYKDGLWPFRVRFMGLFDTVASVGLPMSNNTTSKVGTVVSSLRYIVDDRLVSYMGTRPINLAFSRNGVAGADPAPGIYDGHSGWGNKLNIDPMVEEVRHFIAAHEKRNSFPVDSVSSLRKNRISKPNHFYESVYPGVHSDVGGSYAPGEGGRASLPSENLGVIPLIHMYQFALGKGVPLLPVAAWSDKNRADFTPHPDLLESYNHYINVVGPSSSLGELMNKNAGLYYAWRFRAIRLKLHGDKSESDKVSRWNAKYKKDEAGLNKELESLGRKKDAAAKELDQLLQLRAARATNVFATHNNDLPPPSEQDIAMARKKLDLAKDDFLKTKARLDALPKMAKLQEMLDFYDDQLLSDVKSIRGPLCERYPGMAPPDVLRRDLRPHYKALVKAYEDEFIDDNGLTDEKLVKFFDTYIHNSLAGFAKDATLPSDPRVIYLGGDEKYQYANLGDDLHDGNREIEAA